MSAPSPAGASDLTRRQALQAGGTTAAAAFVFLHPWATAVARAADGSGDAPKHLLRSSYVDLANKDFATDAGVLRLEGVRDLPAAAQVPSFVDSEDAFALAFSGPATVESGPVALRHSELGSFDLYLGDRSPDGHYDVVVNRVLSNRESRRTPPKPSKPADPAPAPPPDEGLDTRTGAPAAAAAAPAGPKPKRRNKTIRSVETKRTKHGAKVVVELTTKTGVTELTGWLTRDEKILATASRKVHGKRVAFNLKPGKRLRKGVYELQLIAQGRDGEQYSRRVRVRLK
jgi:hypothetical protein